MNIRDVPEGFEVKFTLSARVSPLPEIRLAGLAPQL